MSIRIQVIGDDVFFDGELVAVLNPNIPTTRQALFRDFLAENEYQDSDDATPDLYSESPPPSAVVAPRSPWAGIARR